MDNLEIIQKFFSGLKCGRCDSFFDKDSIELVREEENNIVVRITCSACGKNLGLAILGIESGEYKNSLKFETDDESSLINDDLPANPITYEEVIKAHEFFSGLGADWMKYLP
ncbi:MAG: hypothetical protein GX568_09235 [Candidatus Gastranaerophilales bacterium]|jgi:Zn ribbon nucleic-acid-binding protein|nr:hypothetical protein [Candidatus Gastranaerophilales bacterium]